MAGEKIIAIFIAMTIVSAQNNIQVIHDLSGELSNESILQGLWQKNDISEQEIPSYWYFTNAGQGHYRLYQENEVAIAVKKYAGMAGMENEEWTLRRISYIDGVYHAYVESEMGNELYILLSEMGAEMYFIIAADIRKSGEAEILLQDERYSYNSMLEWNSYADWFYGEKRVWDTIHFECEGNYFDHTYEDGCHYAICDYLERTDGDRTSYWMIEENSLYVGRNGYIADIYCTNGKTGISLLIDVWNHSYAVLENDTEPVKADGKSTEDDVEIFKTEESKED